MQVNQQIVFVDSQVLDLSFLTNGVKPGIKVIILESDRNGISQITEVLKKKYYSKVHIVAHGSPGCLYLGNSQLNLDTLTQDKSDIETWFSPSPRPPLTTPSPSLLLYGCNVAAGDAGQEFIAKLRNLTGREITASTTPIGNAKLGGNWQLDYQTWSRVKSEFQEHELAFTAETQQSYAGVLAVASSTITTPDNVFIGAQDVELTVTFDNTGVNPGYGPFSLLYLDTTGADGAGSGIDDGLTFKSAQYLGVDLIQQSYTFDENGQATVTVGNESIVIDAPPGFEPGDTVVYMELPFGSFVPDQPPADIAVTVDVSDLADKDTPLNILSQTGYKFGEDPLDNPGADPIILEDINGKTNDAIAPELVRITKNYIGPESETSTGPNYVRQYELIVDIAPGQTINNLDVTDLLPDTMQFVDVASIEVANSGAGGVNEGFVVSDVSTPDDGGLTSIGSTNITENDVDADGNPTPGGTLTKRFDSVTGGNGENDVVVTVDFYVPRLDAPGDVIINADSGDDIFDTNQSQLGDNDTTDGNNIWAAIDSRDENPEVYIEAGDADNVTDHVLEEQSIAIQKSVVNAEDNSQDFIPGDTLSYTLDFQVSDYFAFEDIIVTDSFSDGQRFNTEFIPIVEINEQGGTSTGELDFTFNNYTPSEVSDSDGGETLIIDETDIDNVQDDSGDTVLTFDISDELIDSGLDGQLIGGAIPQGGFQDPEDLNNNPLLPGGATTGTITFETIVQDQYSDVYQSGDASVDQSDRLDNEALIDGAVLDVLDADTTNDPGTPDALTPTGQREDDDTAALIGISDGALFKSIYAINGVVAPGADTDDDPDDGLDGYTSDIEVTPGDSITYRLTYQLPTSDVEEFQLTDFFPLPVFDVGTEFASSTFSTTFDDTGATVPNPGQTHYGPLDTFHQVGNSPTPSLSFDAEANTLNYFYGDFDDVSNTPAVVDLLVTVTAEDDPFTDDLLLTNQARQSQENTFNEVSTRDAIVQITLREPELNITKGVVAHNSGNENVEFDPTPPSPSDITFAPGSAPVFSGDSVVSSSDLDTTPVDSNLTGELQVGDVVTFAIVVENTGGSRKGAFDAQIQDALPDGFAIPAGGLNLNVTDGTGAELEFTGLGDPDSVGNDLFGNGIELTDPGATPATGDNLTAETDAGAIDAFSETSGRNIAIVSYDLQVNSDSTYVNPATLENTARVVSYSNLEGGDSFDQIEDNATVEIEQPEATKEIVATSEAHTPETGDGSNFSNAREATIGEIVRYRLVSRIPEGSAVDFVLKDNLPNGHTFLNDGTSTVAFVSNGDGVSSSTLGTTPANTGSEATDASNFVNLDDAAISSNLNNNQDDYNTGTDVHFKLGDIVNGDRDVDDEFVVIEFNALVDNNSVAGTTNDAGDILRNNFQIISDGNVLDTSNITRVKVVEPQVEVDKLVKESSSEDFTDSISNIDAQDLVNYSVTFSNPVSNGSVSTAFDVEMSDTLPEFLELQSIDSISWNDGTTTGTGTGGTLNLVDSSDLANNQISLAADLLPQDATVTVNYTAQVLSNVTPTLALENNANVTYTSLPGESGTVDNPTGSNLASASGADNGERNGVDPGGTANDYSVSDVAAITTSSFDPVKSIVETSEASTTGNNLTIGEIARYRLLVQIPEGNTNNLQISDLLPEGLRYLDDGTSKVALVSDGGLVSDTITDEDAASTDPSVTPDFDIIATDSDDANTTFESGEDPTFTLGNLTNTDNDTNSEYVAIEFNAVVENVVGNQDPGTLDNSFTVSGDNTDNVDSNIVSIDLVEPAITNVLKTADIEQAEAGDTVTFTVTYTNEGNSTAFDVTLLDEPASSNYNNLQITDVSSDGTLSTRTSNSTSSKIDETLAEVAIGETITLTYTADLAATLNPGDVAGNNVNIAYSSLPSTGTSPNSTGSTPPDEQRDGSDGIDSALNNYTDGSLESVSINSYSLGSTIFEDLNNNGLQDDNESGIDSVTVQLFDADGTEIPVGGDGILGTADDGLGGMVTNNNGNYFFGGLTPGDYQVVIPESNFDTGGSLDTTPFTSTDIDTADNGEDGDNNGIQAGGTGTVVTSPVITLSALDEPTTEETLQGGNQDNGTNDANGDMTVDLGFFGYGNITGNVSEGMDLDPEGDVAIPEVLLTLLDSNGNSIATTNTDDNGNYSFGNLLPGDYTIEQTQPSGFVSISDNEGGNDNTIAVTITSAETDSGNNFVEAALSLGSTVFVDENNNGLLDVNEFGIENVLVQLFDTNDNEIPVGADGILGTADDGLGGVVTDSDGNYFFDGLAPGEYQVVIPESNFDAGNALENTPFSSADTVAIDNGVDNDNNGIQSAGRGTEVVSPNITLEIGQETRSEFGLGSNQDDSRDSNGDMTVDFGLVDAAKFFNTDYGDAPDSLSDTLSASNNLIQNGKEIADYRTRAEDDGAAHIIDPNLKLGNNIDADGGEFHNADANSDEFNGLNDEDGVTFPEPMGNYNIDEYSVEVDVTNNTTEDATLIGWIDFDNDGLFEANEAVSQTIAAGSGQQFVTLEWTELSGVARGFTYGRFRVSTDPSFDTIDNSTSFGLAQDGEVEDYFVCIAD